MLRFGGTITLNGLVVYVAYNLEKVLLGRFWGPDALGIYGRAYQLINIPTDNLNSAIGGVAFSALSRLQNDPVRLKSYFLKGYSLVISLTIPITIFCALFADDIVLVILGPKWTEAAVIFRLLTPTVLIFGMINPFVVAALVHRAAGTKFGNCTGHCSPGHYGLRYWIALWPQRYCVRLFGCDDAVACSTYCVVPIRYDDFSMGPIAAIEPAVSFRHCGCGLCRRSPILFRPIGISVLATCIWRRCYAWVIFLDAPVCYGTENVLSGASQGIENTLRTRRGTVSR